MITCPTCRLSAPQDATRCPNCGSSLLAPVLGEGPDAPFDTLSPTLFTGERIGPEQDLMALLRDAPDGAELQLTEGTFVLREAVSLTRRIALVGSGRERTVVIGRGADFTLRSHAPGGLVLRNLTLAHEGNLAADVLWVSLGRIDLQNCRFRGARGRGASIGGDAHGVVRACEFVDNQAEGLVMTGSSAPLVEQCLARGNRGEGFCVRETARPTLANNRAVVNYQTGIAFYDDSRGVARENLCAQNGLSGVAVFNQAAPDLTANTLRANNRSGLAYWNQTAGTASQNVCEENAQDGIEVHDAAKPHVLGNTARRNRGSGLAFSGRARGMAMRNRCEDNEGHGLVQRDQAAPTVAGNVLARNAQGDAMPARLATL